MLCKILIINMLDYKFKRFIFNVKITLIISLTKTEFNRPLNVRIWQISKI